MADRTINSLPSLGLTPSDEFEIQQAGDGPSGKATLAEILAFVPDEAAWGSIVGDIDNQIDLIQRLDLKTDVTAFNAHVADGTVHYPQSAIDHTRIQNIGNNTHAQIDSHIANTNIHFTQEQIDHTRIQNRGTNTHAQIDSHIADRDIHFSDAPDDDEFYARRNLGWVRDPAFAGAGSSFREGWVPDPGALSRQYFLEDSGNWEPIPIQPVATPTAKYNNAGVSGPVNPGSGNITVNNGDPALVTEAYVSATANTGNNLSFIWRAIAQGDILAVFASGGGSNVNYWRVTAQPIDNAAWFIVPVENIEFTGPLSGTNIEIFFIQRQVGDGNEDGQMLVWDQSVDRLWGPTSAIKVDFDTSDVLVANNLFVDDDVVAGGGARETYTSVGQLQATRSGGAATGLLIHTRSDQSGYITFGDGEVAGRIQYNHSNDTMSFNTNGNEAMRIASAGGVMIGTASTNGALLRLKQKGGSFTDGLQIASSGADDYLGYLVAQFAGDKFTVGAGGPDGDPAQGGKLAFSDFGYGWSLHVGDGAGGQIRTLYAARNGIVIAERGDLRGGNGATPFIIRNQSTQYLHLIGGAVITDTANIILYDAAGPDDSIQFRVGSAIKLSHQLGGSYWHFRDQNVDYAPVVRARSIATPAEFTQISSSALQYSRNTSYIDQVFDGGQLQFRMSNGGDRNIDAMRILADGSLLIGSIDRPANSILFVTHENLGNPLFERRGNDSGSIAHSFRKARGALNAPREAVQDGDTIGGFAAWGYDGAEYDAQAQIAAVVTGPVDVGDVPVSLDFRTGGSSTANNRLRILPNGTFDFYTNTLIRVNALQGNGTQLQVRASGDLNNFRAVYGPTQLSWLDEGANVFSYQRGTGFTFNQTVNFEGPLVGVDGPIFARGVAFVTADGAWLEPASVGTIFDLHTAIQAPYDANVFLYTGPQSTRRLFNFTNDGFLALPIATPAQGGHAASKQYVDTTVTAAVNAAVAALDSRLTALEAP